MAAISAARRAFNDPGSVAFMQAQTALVGEYARSWAYYRNDDASVFSQAYLDKYSLYRYTRLIFNPVPVITAFYEDHVYPGIAPEGQFALEDGTQLVTPVTDNTPDELKGAIAQLDQWGNWQSEAPRLVRFGAVTGNVLIEVIDDTEREKVLHRIVWPSHVKEFVLDATGNVKAYTLEYQAYDSKKKEHYTFRKEVDSESFRYFRDDRPFDYTERAQVAGGADGYRYNDADEGGRVSTGVYDNPYGFVPAVWVKHIDDGLDYGSPAVWNLSKVDEVNSVVSHANDGFHKALEAHKVLSTDGEVVPVTGASGSTANGGVVTPYDTRRDWMLLKTPKGATLLDLGSLLDLTKSDPSIDRLLRSFEKDYPELQAQEIIQNKAQLSGAALERMLAPSQAKLDRAAANYNQQVIKLKQMSVAIAGWRFKSGWKKKDKQQQRFAQFGLDSYSKGELNFGIKRSLLVQSTEMEQEELRAKKIDNASKAAGLYDELTRLEMAGESRDSAIQILARRAKIDPVVLAKQVEEIEEGEEVAQ